MAFPGRSLALILAIVLLAALLDQASGAKKRKEVVDRSESGVLCSTCKRMVMGVNQTILEDLIKEVRLHHGAKVQNLAFGKAEEIIQERYTGICKQSAIWLNETRRAACENLLDQHEEAIVVDLLAFARNQEAFDLTNQLCHVTMRCCPKNVNFSTLITEIKVPKKELWSERPGSDEPVNFKKLVASAWLEQVVERPGDVVSYQFNHSQWEQPDAMDKFMVELLKEASEIIRECPTIILGTVNLGLNDIPDPFGSFLEPKTLSMWGHEAKQQPHFKKDLAGGDLSVQDLLDFIMTSAGMKESVKCMEGVAGRFDKPRLRELQRHKFRDEL